MSVADDVPDALGVADGAGLLPPMLTGCAEPMLVPGAITATAAASVMYRPAGAGGQRRGGKREENALLRHLIISREMWAPASRMGKWLTSSRRPSARTMKTITAPRSRAIHACPTMKSVASLPPRAGNAMPLIA